MSERAMGAAGAIMSRWKLETIIHGEAVASEIATLDLAILVTRIGAAQFFPHIMTRLADDCPTNLAQNLHHHTNYKIANLQTEGA